MKAFRSSKNTGLSSAHFLWAEDVFDIIWNALCPRIPVLSDFPQAIIDECLGYSHIIWKTQYIIHNDVESRRKYLVIV